MPDIFLDLRPWYPTQTKKVKNALEDIKATDNVNIVLERTDAHNADAVFEILRGAGYVVQGKGGNEDQYNIVARPRR